MEFDKIDKKINEVNFMLVFLLSLILIGTYYLIKIFSNGKILKWVTIALVFIIYIGGITITHVDANNETERYEKQLVYNLKLIKNKISSNKTFKVQVKTKNDLDNLKLYLDENHKQILDIQYGKYITVKYNEKPE